MTNFRKSLIGGIAATALAAIGAGPATAATTVGDSVVVTNTGCVAGNLFTSNAPQYQTPAGVITAFSTRRGMGGGIFALKVVTNGSITGSSAVVTSTDGLNTYATRIPVAAGARLAVWVQNNQACTYGDGAASVFAQNTISDPPIGTPVSLTSPEPGVRLSIDATVEADIDGDGFGDETQDACTANPARQAEPCVDPAPPAGTPLAAVVAAPTCKVPSLKGKTQSAAKSALQKAGCKLGKTKKKKLSKFTKKNKRNRVRAQSRAANSTVAAGTAVDITINVKKAKKA